MTSGMEYCNERDTGALCGKGPWSTVITGIMENCDDKGMEHCDDRWHGAL